jgi:hypothetical protein
MDKQGNEHFYSFNFGTMSGGDKSDKSEDILGKRGRMVDWSYDEHQKNDLHRMGPANHLQGLVSANRGAM